MTVDFNYPIEFEGGGLKMVSGPLLDQSSVYMRVTTVYGERPYVPGYGVPSNMFNGSEEYPINVASVTNLEGRFEPGDSTVRYG